MKQKYKGEHPYALPNTFFFLFPSFFIPKYNDERNNLIEFCMVVNEYLQFTSNFHKLYVILEFHGPYWSPTSIATH